MKQEMELELMEAMSGIRPAYLEEAQEAREAQPKRKSVLTPVFWGRAAAAAFALSVILPNTTPEICHAMQSVPVLGAYFRLVTFREYSYADEFHEANVELSGIEADAERTDGALSGAAAASAQEVNRRIADKTEELIREFEASLESEGYRSLEIRSEVVTDSDRWYVLCLNAYTAQADGYEERQYYVLNRETGELTQLSDLFREGSDYRGAISAEIIRQMTERMEADPEKTYFINTDMPEEDFRGIGEAQSFYMNGDGNIVIVFEEGEVAPMSMGVQEFVIPAGAVQDMLAE